MIVQLKWTKLKWKPYDYNYLDITNLVTNAYSLAARENKKEGTKGVAWIRISNIGICGDPKEKVEKFEEKREKGVTSRDREEQVDREWERRDRGHASGTWSLASSVTVALRVPPSPSSTTSRVGLGFPTHWFNWTQHNNNGRKGNRLTLLLPTLTDRRRTVRFKCQDIPPKISG